MNMTDLLKRRGELKEKFKKRKRIFAGWTSLYHPSIAEIFAKAGLDYIGIDMEHSTVSQEQAQRIIVSSQEQGSLCLPRIASHNPEMARRLLDSGADGLIVPNVATVNDVKQIISWIKYPPKGKRGFGVARAQGYGFDFAEYVKSWNETSVVIVQIESIEAVENVESIIAFDEVDGVMIGPYDISGSLGIPGQIEHESVKEAGRRVVEACRKKKKSCGIQIVAPDTKNIEQAFNDDYTFIVLASDIFILWKWAENIKGAIKRSQGALC